MRKLIFTLTFFLLWSYSASAQNFTFERISPALIHGDTGGTGQQWGSKSVFKNISQDTIRFFIERTFEDFPDSTWYSAMCTQAGCYAPFVNIVPDPSFEDNALAPGQQDTVTLYFYSRIPGVGTVHLRMYEQNIPSVYIEHVYMAQLGTVGITQISSVVEDYKLDQNFPNPFNPSTIITFSIPKTEMISLKIYNSLGMEIKSLLNNERLSAGKYEVDVDAAGLSSGVYFYTLNSGSFTQTRKMILQK
jgi:hypothetical protein